MKQSTLATFCLLINLLAATSLRAQPTKPATNPFTGEQLFKDVQTYVAFGEHRTGTEADGKTAEWLKSTLAAAGFTTSYQDFPLNQYFHERASLRLGDQSVEVFPAWPVPSALPSTTEARLVDSGTEKDSSRYRNAIVLTRLAYWGGASFNKAYISQLNRLINAGSKAVVAITEGSTQEIIALNAPSVLKPWTVPVVLAAPKDSARLLTHARATTPAILQLAGNVRTGVTARNVIGRLGTGDKFVVVSTPISGWFTCGGERGPGVALFNAFAKWVGAQKLPYQFIFVATSGHEIGGLGMHAFMHSLAPKPDQVHLWLHLGAGLATVAWQKTPQGWQAQPRADSLRYLMYSENLQESAQRLFASVAIQKVLVKGEAVGELDLIMRKGYPSFYGIAAGHRFHHTRQDDARKTSPALLAEIAKPLQGVMAQYLSTGTR